DGIRDYKVTGVQTCALPISPGCSVFPLPRSLAQFFQLRRSKLQSTPGRRGIRIHLCRFVPKRATAPRVTGSLRPIDRLGGYNLADRKSTRLNSSHLVISYAV